jgi:hypothetical protein
VIKSADANEQEPETLAEEQQMDISVADFELMIAACACTYVYLATDLPTEHLVSKAYHWREFFVGWNDNDEAKTDTMIEQGAEIMHNMVEAGELTSRELTIAAQTCDALESGILEFFADGSAARSFEEYNHE